MKKNEDRESPRETRPISLAQKEIKNKTRIGSVKLVKTKDP